MVTEKEKMMAEMTMKTTVVTEKEKMTAVASQSNATIASFPLEKKKSIVFGGTDGATV